MDFTEFSLRYAIICAIAVVAVYLLVSLAGLAKIKLQQRVRQREMTLDGNEVYWITPEQGVAEEEVRLTEPRREPHVPAQLPGQAPTQVSAQLSDQLSAKLSPQAPAKFGEQLFRSSIEAELQQLRSELAGLKDNVAQLKAARRVSPQYNEAMRLAQNGMDVHDIADECGISMGEAELVLALSRNKQEYEDHDR